MVYRIRERVEPIVLLESSPHLAPEAIDRMAAIQERIEAERDLETFLELDRAFHELSYSACPMTSMVEMVDRFWDTTQHYRRTYSTLMGEEGWRAADAEHRLILDALRVGDHDVAAHVLEVHIRRSRLRLAAHPEVFADVAPAAE
jgi:DNA-binding GntR family transcriptional regulator